MHSQSSFVSANQLRILNDIKYKSSQLESLDYDQIDSDLNLEEHYSKTPGSFVKLNLERWAVSFLIGAITALMAVAIQQGVKRVSWYKFEAIARTYHACGECFYAPLVVFVLLNMALVAVASGLVCFWSPPAKGSGIPEIKSYLNGIKMPEVLRIKTLFVKVVGVICAVSGGLAVGKEGPMIHTGCVIAGGLSQGKSTTLPVMNTRLFGNFRNDTEKRDFVSSGIAAGVAAAFGAPVGGVLLSLEEGASFWNQHLTWRTFFCAMVSTFTLNFFLSGIDGDGWGALSNPGLVDFGDFVSQLDRGYQIYTLPLFMILGVVGGFLGALFNSINYKIMLFRQKYINKSKLRMFTEAVSLAGITGAIAFTVSYFVHECRKISSTNVIEDVQHFQYFCPAGYYNDMATIFCTTQEKAIYQLFHDVQGESFSVPTLIGFAILYYFLVILGCGIAVPAALFVPGLLLGAAYGRLFGVLVQTIIPQWNVNPGTFALIGAASMLGGIVRMTISLTVILMEATGDLIYGLPLMITLMISKWIGDFFNHGLYDIHIHLQHIPILEWESPFLMRKYLAHTIMSSNVYCFEKVENVSNVYKVLKNTRHNGFPIVTRNGNLCGLILRSQLVTLLKQKAFKSKTKEKFYNRVQVDDFARDYPRYPKLEEVDPILTPKDMNKMIDLTHYMNKTPYIIHHDATLTRVYRIFRTMGLRHMVVIDYECKVVGIITRHDLAHFEERLREMLENEEEVNNINERSSLLFKQ